MAPFTIATMPSLNIGRFQKSPNLILPIRCSMAAPSPSSVSIRSKAVHFDLKTYWISLMAQINQKLDEAIEVQFPQQIYEAMRYSALAKGAKRSPPVMCISACELFGGSRLAAFPTACALEMVTFFLYDAISILFYCIMFLVCFFTLRHSPKNGLSLSQIYLLCC